MNLCCVFIYIRFINLIKVDIIVQPLDFRIKSCDEKVNCFLQSNTNSFSDES